MLTPRTPPGGAALVIGVSPKTHAATTTTTAPTTGVHLPPNEATTGDAVPHSYPQARGRTGLAVPSSRGAGWRCRHPAVRGQPGHRRARVPVPGRGEEGHSQAEEVVAVSTFLLGNFFIREFLRS